MRILKGWVVGALALGSLAVVQSQAQAAPRSVPALVPIAVVEQAGENVTCQYYGHYGWHRHWGGGYGWHRPWGYRRPYGFYRPVYGWHRPYGWRRPYGWHRHYGWHRW